MHISRTKVALTITTTLCLVLGGPSASADILFAGSCVVALEVSFSPRATRISSDRAVSIDGGGWCASNAQTSSPPETLIKNIDLGGSGSGTVTTCETFEATGSYIATFSPSPAPPTSNGTFVLAGSPVEVTLDLAGLGPIFVAHGSLVLDLGNAGEVGPCALSTGTSRLTYTGSLTFGDP